MTEPSASSRAYRIGIDVGGTFTKAVLIDNATYEVVGRFSVLTTHSDPRGVAKGVVDVFRNVLEHSRRRPEGSDLPRAFDHPGHQRVAGGRRRQRRRHRHGDPRGIAAGQGPERHEADRACAGPPPETGKPVSDEGDADRRDDRQGDRGTARRKAQRSSSRAAPSASTTTSAEEAVRRLRGRCSAWPRPAATRSPSSMA